MCSRSLPSLLSRGRRSGLTQPDGGFAVSQGRIPGQAADDVGAPFGVVGPMSATRFANFDRTSLLRIVSVPVTLLAGRPQSARIESRLTGYAATARARRSGCHAPGTLNPLASRTPPSGTGSVRRTDGEWARTEGRCPASRNRSGETMISSPRMISMTRFPIAAPLGIANTSLWSCLSRRRNTSSTGSVRAQDDPFS